MSLKKPLYLLISLCFSTLSPVSFALLPYANTGNLYVSMWTEDEVRIFTPDGLQVDSFRHAELDGPRGIAFNPANGEIWVASEHSDAIFIFSHQHEYLRQISHEDFDEPLGITFASDEEVNAEDQLVYISNSNGNEMMIFNQAGELQNRFTSTSLNDPNCSALMGDGTLYVTNRLGGNQGIAGALDKYNTDNTLLFRSSVEGMSSLMAVARDPNGDGFDDDTVWTTSGGGDRAIYEFDQAGNLLTTIEPADIDGGVSITPQGLAFDDQGNFFVVSWNNEVFKFDGDGNYISRFATGSGTARSVAFQACEGDKNTEGCVVLGSTQNSTSEDLTNNDNTSNDTVNTVTDGNSDTNSDNMNAEMMNSGSSGGGTFSYGFLLIMLFGMIVPCKK